MRLLLEIVVVSLCGWMIPAAASFAFSRNSQRHCTWLASTSKDHFDREELRRRIHPNENPPFFVPHSRPHTVHIVTFHNDDATSGGIHSVEYPPGSGRNVILAFESKQACDNFAARLKDQHFFEPTPQPVVLKDLEDGFEPMGVLVQVVPKGMEVIPPSRNVPKFGCNPNLRKEQDRLDSIYYDSEQTANEGLLDQCEHCWE